jgi:hypothetical protein
MNRTWFICPTDGRPVRIEHPIEEGATDDQWRAFIRLTGIRMKNDTKPWGPLARRDFLNMLEDQYPERLARLRFFDSKEAALVWLTLNRDGASNVVSESESNEESSKANESDKLLMAIELLRSKPGATDEDVRKALDLRTLGTARFWKIKAREVLGMPLDGVDDEHQGGSTR